VFLIVLSRAAVESRWVKAETDWAFGNRAGAIIPVLIEPCDYSDFHLMMSQLQYIDLCDLVGATGGANPRANRQILDATIRIRTSPRSSVEQPRAGDRWVSPMDGQAMLWIPEGDFSMGIPGTEVAGLAKLFGIDNKQHRVRIAEGFWLDQTPVTNGAFSRFVKANPDWSKGAQMMKRHLSNWTGQGPPQGEMEHAVTWVSWHAAPTRNCRHRDIRIEGPKDN
jgi:formylglycine-generating enzyme required for sulfatase activity